MRRTKCRMFQGVFGLMSMAAVACGGDDVPGTPGEPTLPAEDAGTGLGVDGGVDNGATVVDMSVPDSGEDIPEPVLPVPVEPGPDVATLLGLCPDYAKAPLEQLLAAEVGAGQISIGDEVRTIVEFDLREFPAVPGGESLVGRFGGGAVTDRGELMFIPVGPDSSEPTGEIFLFDFTEEGGLTNLREGTGSFAFDDDNGLAFLSGNIANGNGGGESIATCIATGAGSTVIQVEGTDAVINGVIGSLTLAQFEALTVPGSPVTRLVFQDMPGSDNDPANLAAARLVRQAGWNTYVDQGGLIASGAVDMFSAGVERTAHVGVQVGVHSWANLEEGLFADQIPMDHPYHQPYIDYLNEMVGPEVGEAFYWFTVEAASFEDLYFMTAEELVQYNVITQPLLPVEGTAPPIGEPTPSAAEVAALCPDFASMALPALLALDDGVGTVVAGDESAPVELLFVRAIPELPGLEAWAGQIAGIFQLGNGRIMAVPFNPETGEGSGELIVAERTEDGVQNVLVGTAQLLDSEAEEQGLLVGSLPLADGSVLPIAACGVIGAGSTRISLEGMDATINGTIGPVTALQIDRLIAEGPAVERLVMPEMPGSINDEVNLVVAQMVREAGWNTHVPAGGIIESGAVDLFCAGVERTAAPDAQFGVHSWGNPAEGVQASDFPMGSPEHQPYIDYLNQMVGEDYGADFYWFTVNAAPFDGMYYMTPEELARYNVLTN